MAISPKVAKSTVYSIRVRKATAHRREAATHGIRLHAAGPWTGGDGPDEQQRLWLRLRPLRRSR